MSLRLCIACTAGKLISLWIHFIIYKWLILQHFLWFHEPINTVIKIFQWFQPLQAAEFPHTSHWLFSFVDVISSCWYCSLSLENSASNRVCSSLELFNNVFRFLWSVWSTSFSLRSWVYVWVSLGCKDTIKECWKWICYPHSLWNMTFPTTP